MRIRRLIGLALVTGAMVAGSALPAQAHMHVRIPGDECGVAAQSGGASASPAHDVLVGLRGAGILTFPLGGPHFTPWGNECPAPHK